MKAAIYARVSKDEQNPQTQVDALKGYAERHEYDIYKVYTDVASGAKDSRPALNDLMFDARQKYFDAIIVWKLDRLGRSLKHLINIIEEWQQKGIDLICTTQNIDTTTVTGKLFFHLVGAFAEFERELISERTKEGLKKAQNVGKRGPDKRPRRKSGYYLRYAKKGVKK